MPKVIGKAPAPLTRGQVVHQTPNAERTARSARAAREAPAHGTNPDRFQPQRPASRPQKPKAK